MQASEPRRNLRVRSNLSKISREHQRHLEITEATYASHGFEALKNMILISQELKYYYGYIFKYVPESGSSKMDQLKAFFGLQQFA